MAIIMADQENRTLNDKFMLRLPDGMRERIKVIADKNGRSMNAEIVELLERHIPSIPSVKDVIESSDYIAFQLKELLERDPDLLDQRTMITAKSLMRTLNELDERLKAAQDRKTNEIKSSRRRQ
ncbi:Arc-like DNA binding domain-containing protein [Thioclava dalianensis]|nr:Arc family DNA-binding protein [Thioclava dalianensis]SFN84375.1 Arc-like DNA binding domain-containing protein [Thioclava dalianensis]